MEKKKINKIYKEIKSLNPRALSEIRDKLIPVFLELEKDEPFKDKKVITMLKRRYELALKEYKYGKLMDAEKHLKRSLG